MSFIGNLRVRTIVAIVALLAGAAFWWIFGSRIVLKRALIKPYIQCTTPDGKVQTYEDVLNWRYSDGSWEFLVRTKDGDSASYATNNHCTIADRRTND